MTYPEYYWPPNIPTSGWYSIVLFSSTATPPLRSFAMYGVMFIFNPITVYYLEYRGLRYSFRLYCPVWDTLVDLNRETTDMEAVRLGLGTSILPHNAVFTCKTILELYDYIRKLQILEKL